MGALDIFFKKKKNEIEEIENMSYIEEAEKAASIVDEYVEKGDYSKLNKKLEELPTNGISRETYVFKPYDIKVSAWLIVVSILFLVAFIYFLVIGMGVTLYSSIFRKYGVVFLGISVVVITVNLKLFINTINIYSFNRRFRKYMNSLKYRNIQIVEDLSSFSNIKIEIVLEDLKKAVKENLIPQGHFGTNNMIFIVSDAAYEVYLEKQAVYDRYYRKLVEGRDRMKNRSEDIQKILDVGEEYVKKIKDCNAIIKDSNITKKLDRMEDVVAMIFHEVDINPQHADKLGLFLNYYLPTTEKLLEAYIDIDEKRLKSKSVEKTKKNIENSLDTINSSFEGILDRFYQEQEIDIISDISSMELMMRQEGIVDSEE